MLVLNEIAGNLPDDDPEVNALLDAMMLTENTMIDAGLLLSYHVYLVGRKSSQELCSQRNSESLRSLNRFS